MNARALAATALESVTAGGRSLTAALDEILPKAPKEQDRAFIQALCFGVLRQYWRLDFLLRQLATKPIRDEQIRLLALLGLYQLEFTRVKPYAAVAETVSAVGRKSWARALLNGILRNYQRQREHLQSLADDDLEARFAHPAWLIERLRADWPAEYETILLEGNRQAPLCLRVNPLQTSREAYLLQLQGAGLGGRPARFAPQGIVLTDASPVERLPGFAEGRASVQDAAAQLAAGLLNTEPGQRVLDVCAAPGGKTAAILEACPECEMVAVDIAPERNARVRENLERAGFEAKIITGDAANPMDWWDGRPFDRILLDAPCSATGVIRRHPDIKWLRRPEDIAALAATQAHILEATWPLLAPGGLMLYATCSVLREENEARIAAFLNTQPDAQERRIIADWGCEAGYGRQILPGEEDMDGFYYCLLEHRA
ncbi:16S rRNA (cytosine(967)-C(5))-methyltransferase RsmB [Methyloterricola oryzae]|uniref:16S rRNA (cytosine(967)-C(5))-methyltransferase RsmB n=1 Tax=Methyloterricola oryzae TaxID=1495050 RepID=UPI0005EBE377|nr:16S rRNA (cytosine(967)-C(5))-methyltransferase RsmB [Methyloterricola oryzae]